MSEIEKFVKVEMIRDVPLEDIVDLMDKYEKENAELREGVKTALEKFNVDFEHHMNSRTRVHPVKYLVRRLEELIERGEG